MFSNKRLVLNYFKLPNTRFQTVESIYFLERSIVLLSEFQSFWEITKEMLKNMVRLLASAIKMYYSIVLRGVGWEVSFEIETSKNPGCDQETLAFAYRRTSFGANLIQDSLKIIVKYSFKTLGLPFYLQLS